MRYVKGWVACVEKKDKSRFVNGSFHLYSEPHPTEKQAQDWVWAINSTTYGGVKLIRMECNDVPEERLVQPLDRESTNPGAMTDLIQFVSEHAIRGTCECGKCIDAPTESQQPEGHTSDLVFFKVAAKGDPSPAILRQLVIDAKRGCFNDMDPFDGEEHSYIEVGGWVGDQGMALTLMGLGEILGLWNLMTPKKLPGLPDVLIQQMAGAGMITIMPPSAKKETQDADSKENV
jgi:hypothetical protein